MLHHICKHRQYSVNYKDTWVPCSHHCPHLLLQGHQFIYCLCIDQPILCNLKWSWWETCQVQRAARLSIWIWTCLDYVCSLCLLSSWSWNILTCICKSLEGLLDAMGGVWEDNKTKHVLAYYAKLQWNIWCSKVWFSLVFLSFWKRPNQDHSFFPQNEKTKPKPSKISVCNQFLKNHLFPTQMQDHDVMLI